MAFGNQIKQARTTATNAATKTTAELNAANEATKKANEATRLANIKTNEANKATKLANIEANKAYDKAIEATKLAGKYAHSAAQNKHKVTVKDVEHTYEMCKATNEYSKLSNDITGTPIVLEDCLKVCTDFNSLIDTYNSNHGFAGDMAFAHAECN